MSSACLSYGIQFIAFSGISNFNKIRYGTVIEFLRASAMLKHIIDIGWTSVCQSDVTRWYCIKTAEQIVMLSSPHYSPFILVLCVPNLREIPTGLTPRGR